MGLKASEGELGGQKLQIIMQVSFSSESQAKKFCESLSRTITFMEQTI